MMAHPLHLSVGLVLIAGCSAEKAVPAQEEVPAPAEVAEEAVVLEITPGESIGPVNLGITYGALESVHGPPDDVTIYNRIFFATWDALGVEVVMGSALDDALEEGSLVVSVGTVRDEGFSGVVVPGMTRAEADSLLGECPDVIDDKHCYHPVGVYLGYDRDGIIDTVAVHPAFTLRPEPPEMVPALGLGGLQ